MTAPLIQNLFTHALVTGGTGCGKTQSVVLPILEQCVHENSDKPNLKPAIFVTDVKGDVYPALKKMCEATGRTKDLIDLSLGGKETCDLLSYLSPDPDTAAGILYRSANCKIDAHGSGSENIYWDRGAIVYLSSAFQWLAMLGVRPSADNLIQFFRARIGDDWVFDGSVNVADDDRKMLWDSLKSSPDEKSRILALKLGHIFEYQNLDPKTRLIFASIFSQFVDLLINRLMQLVLSSQPTFSETSWLEEGKILVVRFPFDMFPDASNSAVRLLKMSLFRRVLSRNQADLKHVRRPCYFVIDEAQRFITKDSDSGDQFFVDRCRAFKAGCIYASQSLNSLNGIFGEVELNTFLALMTSRFFGKTLDLPTAEIAQAIMGSVDQIDGYSGNQMIRVGDPDPDVPPQPMRDNIHSSNLIEPSHFASLQPGEFFINEGSSRCFKKLTPWSGTSDVEFDASPTSRPLTFLDLKETRSKIMSMMPSSAKAPTASKRKT